MRPAEDFIASSKTEFFDRLVRNKNLRPDLVRPGAYVDPEIAPLVMELNRHAQIVTSQCCQGHSNDRAYVSFYTATPDVAYHLARLFTESMLGIGEVWTRNYMVVRDKNNQVFPIEFGRSSPRFSDDLEIVDSIYNATLWWGEPNSVAGMHNYIAKIRSSSGKIVLDSKSTQAADKILISILGAWLRPEWLSGKNKGSDMKDHAINAP